MASTSPQTPWTRLCLNLRASLLAGMAGLFLVACDVPPHAKLPWLTDPEAAREQAVQRNLPLLMLFTGSDWCGPCKILNSHVLSTVPFSQYASSNLVLLKVDFPRRPPLPRAEADRNQRLQEGYAIQGYPTLVLLDPQGRELAREVGLRSASPADLAARLEEFKNRK
ncbi:MAG: thioredoxin family protein [Verrucomicrobia bacterium]|nr:thioredoxin family protein [Verrucomicrobiota bacterium]